MPALIKCARLFDPGVEDFEVFEGDFGGIEREIDRFVFPDARVAQIFRVGVVRDGPIEVAFDSGKIQQQIEQLFGWIEVFVVCFGPMMR